MRRMEVCLHARWPAACPPPIAPATVALATRSRRALFSRFMFTKPLPPPLPLPPSHVCLPSECHPFDVNKIEAGDNGAYTFIALGQDNYHFGAYFIAPYTCIRSQLTYSWNFYCFDGGYFYDEYGGVLLVATTLDPDEQIIILM